MSNVKEKKIIVLLSLVIVFAIAAVLYFQPSFFNHWIIKLETDTYDRQVRRYYKPLPPHPSIVIVDIDDKSINEEGRWPWDRAKIAKLTEELARQGASVIAFDVLFSESQANPVDQVLRVVKDPALAQKLEELKPALDADPLLADALKKSTSILGFAFASNGKEQGELPSPLLSLTESDMKETLIPELNGYIGNQPLLQQAAKGGGFMNAMIDSDGILRFSPLLMRHHDKVYASLALESTKEFLRLPFTGIITAPVRGSQAMQALQLGHITIPTDPWGRILIPYRGPAYSFPYLSATDVLHGKTSPEQVQGKLIFVGISATGSSDLLATSISPVFPGVEVQASIASGILDGYLPHKPNWGRGAAILLVLIIGTMAALSFPYISHFAAIGLFIGVILVLELVNYLLWNHHGIVLAFFFPLPTLATLFILDLIGSYVVDMRRKNKS